FQPSTLALTSVDVGNPAFNVIPGSASARFNARFNDHWTAESLEARLREEVTLAARGAKVDITLQRPNHAFVTKPGRLTEMLSAAVREIAGVTPEASTGGGTSDARFFKGVCPVVEFGLVGETMHQADERVAIADLKALAAIYAEFIARFFSTA